MLVPRVLLVDDHPMFRRGLRWALEESGRYRVVAEAGSGHEAIRLADAHHPDLVLLDIQLPGISGFTVARILRRRHPTAKLVMLSMSLAPDRLFDAIRVGAAACVAKNADVATLLGVLARVAGGENVLHQLILGCPELARRLLGEFRAIDDERTAKGRELGLCPLSIREVEVLDCVAQGLTNKEIAAKLYLTEQTVKNHITSVLRKLDVNDRVQAVVHAVKHGWMELGPTPVGNSQRAAGGGQ